MTWPGHPMLYEINTRVWLRDLCDAYTEPMSLDTVPDAELDELADWGVDAVWLMGVWEPSLQGREVARTHPALQAEYHAALPGLGAGDVVGSPYAVYDYQVSQWLGGERALRRMRQQLAARGLRLILDFVPNHVALDHPWTRDHPEVLLQGSEEDIRRDREGYFAVHAGGKRTIYAHGRDPYFPPWSDTVQVNYAEPVAREAMTGELLRVADLCDGVRCDMAMLVTNAVFEQTWGRAIDEPEFWPVTIDRVRAAHPGFLFIAEVYWGLEWKLQQQGFDYTYDKTLYDRLRNDTPLQVRGHLRADLAYQRRLIRFVENHDEPRAVTALGEAKSRTAATLISTLPGGVLYHEGQFEGRHVRVPVQLGRRPAEEPNLELVSFYHTLLEAVDDDIYRQGTWELLDPRPAWDTNWSHRECIVYLWSHEGQHRLVALNLSGDHAQCYVRVALPGWEGRVVTLADQLSAARFRRSTDDMANRGLYLDLKPFQAHLLRVEAI
jgi:hypothetical protein